jgi:TonB family protein
MIAAWMVAAMVFSLLLGVAAHALERTQRLFSREARHPWIVALGISVVWPLIALLIAAVAPLATELGAPVVLPTVQSAVSVVRDVLPTGSTPWFDRLDTVLMVGWVGLSIVLLIRLAFAMRALRLVERSAKVEIIAGVPVLLTGGLGPAVFGVRRMRFLMPTWLLDLDASLRELVMRHEQEHLRARDPQLTLAVAVAVALVPWNPALWWIARRLRLAMELDCDARVLRTTPDRERYARLLILIAQRQAPNAMVTMLAASTSDLDRRIAEMHTSRSRRSARRVAILTLVAAAAVACSGKVGADLATSPASGAVATTEVTFYSPEGATPAVLVEHPSPEYPAALRSTGVQGEVLAMFVVDSTGRVLDGSLRIVRSTDSLFTRSVRAVVAGMRFDPPALNGRKIRQLVQQSFVFDPRGATSAAAQVARPTSDPTNRNPMPLRPIVVSKN